MIENLSVGFWLPNIEEVAYVLIIFVLLICAIVGGWIFADDLANQKKEDK